MIRDAARLVPLLLLALVCLAGCSGGSTDEGEETRASGATSDDRPTIPNAELIRRNNEAVGLMGQYAYEDALAIFEELSRARPDHADLRVNRAIAQLNRQRSGDEDAAIEILLGVLEDEPDHLRAQYCLGLLLLYRGPPADPAPFFEAVAQAAPNDPDAAYQWAKCLETAGRHDEAKTWYERALDADPYFNSCHLGLSRVHRALGDMDASVAATEDFQAMRENPRARTFDFVYMEMGRLGEAVAFGVDPAPAVDRTDGPVLGGPVELVAALGEPGSRGSSLTVVDLDGDGRLDLVATLGAGGDGGGVTRVLLGGDGSMALDDDHPLAGLDRVRAVLVGDLDDDGLDDVVVCRRGPNLAFRQFESGRYVDHTEAWGLAGADLDSVDGAIVDADHDGDLDVVVVHSDGPLALLNNDRDGGFTDIAPGLGIAEPSAGGRRLLVGDFDGRGDADLLVLRDRPPHALYLNQRLWAYERSSAPFTSEIMHAAAAADLDADGRLDLVMMKVTGIPVAWSRDDRGHWSARELGAAVDGEPVEPGDATLVDLDGDGRLELLVERGGRIEHHPLDGPPLDGRPPAVLATDVLGWSPIVTDPAAGPGILVHAASADGPPSLRLVPPGPGRFDFIALTFSGKTKVADKMRSNASGIGTNYELRVADRWITGSTLPADSLTGQGRQPVAIGLGGAERVDVLELVWSDGVFQSELALGGGTLHAIEETQRQVSSCPVLFAWDGERYAFVSDVLGVGGIGYLLEPGVYSEPRPDESFLMPAGVAVPRDGAYELRLGEPMEEVCYLDHLAIESWHLPPGWRMTLDERLATGPPAVTGAPRFFRRWIEPGRVTDARGVDVTDEVRTVDDRAADPGPLDRRFIGRLAGEHVLTLEFDEALTALPGAGEDGTPMLVADGWVEYPYSQTNFAAWQAGAGFEPPTLEARVGDGPWVTVLDRFGYPAGMPRQMSVPLDGLPDGTTALRLRTNQEVYWDRLFVAFAEHCPDAERHALPLLEARLERPGFPRRTDDPQRRPRYDFDDRTPRFDMRTLPGHYTAFGDVTDLVASADDALVVFGSGEDVRTRFEADEAPPDGWTRRLVVVSRGWCKDMDRFTRGGSSVEPLPVAGAAAEDARRRTEASRTRFVAGP